MSVDKKFKHWWIFLVAHIVPLSVVATLATSVFWFLSSTDFVRVVFVMAMWSGIVVPAVFSVWLLKYDAPLKFLWVALMILSIVITIVLVFKGQDLANNYDLAGRVYGYNKYSYIVFPPVCFFCVAVSVVCTTTAVSYLMLHSQR